MQIAAGALAATPGDIVIRQSDTDGGGHDTGAYGSTGTRGGGPRRAARRGGPAGAILAAAAICSAPQPGASPLARSSTARVGYRCRTLRPRRGAAIRLEGTGRFDGTPRSIAFNVQGFRVAVHRVTGAIRILQSVQAADAGMS